MTAGAGRRPRVAVLDYGAGNLRSAQRGLERAGAEVTVTDDAAEAEASDGLVVPGVGHFGTCLSSLRAVGLADLVERWVAADRHVFGICVGMQLLYEHSDEGDTAGLGVLPGSVRRITADVIVPHMGWDVVHPVPGREDVLLDGVADQRTYFVHSYYAQPSEPAHVVATCDYGESFPCIVRVGNVVGTQFHPEKSGEVGARLLANWVGEVAGRKVRSSGGSSPS